MNTSYRTGIAVALVLALVLAVPLTATAAGPSGEPSATPAMTQTSQQQAPSDATMDQMRVRLRTRIEERLRVRDHLFDGAAERVRARIERVNNLADQVQEAGGDVAAVRARLRIAHSQLVEATSLEMQAARQFRSIPDSPNRRAALTEARQTAARAVLKLGQARKSLRDATAALAQVARGIGS